MDDNINFDELKFDINPNETLAVSLQRRITQRQDLIQKVKVQKLTEEIVEEEYWAILINMAIAQTYKALPESWQSYFSFSHVYSRSKTAPFQLNGSFIFNQPEVFNNPFHIEFVLNFTCRHETILANEVADINILIHSVHVDKAILQSITDYKILTNDLEYVRHRISHYKEYFNGQIFLDLLIEAINIEKLNDAIRNQIDTDLIYVYTRKAIEWSHHAKTVTDTNFLVKIGLDAELFYQFYDGKDETGTLGYINNHRIYRNDVATDQWIYTDNLTQTLKDISNKMPVKIYKKDGILADVVFPNISEISIFLEPLLDTYFFKRIKFAHLSVLVPPNANIKSANMIVDKYKEMLLKYDNKPVAPTIEAIIDQGYYDDHDFSIIGFYLSQINQAFLQYPEED
jgi:hypothetical protein